MRSLSSPGLVADSVDVVATLALALDSFLATELLSVELAVSPFLCVVTAGGEMGKKRERLRGEGGGGGCFTRTPQVLPGDNMARVKARALRTSFSMANMRWGAIPYCLWAAVI